MKNLLKWGGVLKAVGLCRVTIYSRPTQLKEALLLREADMLECLGVSGMVRDFARAEALQYRPKGVGK